MEHKLRGSRFSSQHSHNNSQLSVPPALGVQRPLLSLAGPGTLLVQSYLDIACTQDKAGATVTVLRQHTGFTMEPSLAQRFSCMVFVSCFAFLKAGSHFVALLAWNLD